MRLGELKDELADESHAQVSAENELAEETKLQETLERMKTIHMQIKRQRPIGRHGGQGRWPVHQLCLFRIAVASFLALMLATPTGLSRGSLIAGWIWHQLSNGEKDDEPRRLRENNKVEDGLVRSTMSRMASRGSEVDDGSARKTWSMMDWRGRRGLGWLGEDLRLRMDRRG